MALDMILKLLIYLAPMYFANSCAMLFGGKTALDFGKKLKDGQRIFGKGKTWRGTIAGTAIGIIVTGLIFVFLQDSAITLSPNYFLLGVLLSVGAILGDILASFFKRRNKIESGTQVLFLDQLDFVFGGMILGSIYYVPNFYEIIIISVLTLVVHRVSNYFAFVTKLKNVPW